MNKLRQVVPMLKLMLGFYRYGPLPILIYLVLTTIVLVLSLQFMPMQWMDASNHNSAVGALFMTCCILWYFLMTVSTPVPFVMLSGPISLEFLFTRAIDRVFWLRCERLAVMIFGIGPLLLNLLFSPLGPEITFNPARPTSPVFQLHQRDVEIFPSSPSALEGQWGCLVPKELFAGWVLWSGILCTFLAAAYFSIAFTIWQRTGWHHSKSRWRPVLGSIMVNAPAFSVVVLFVICSMLRINIFAESFFFFTDHRFGLSALLIPLVVLIQWFSERNLRALEFEFF